MSAYETEREAVTAEHILELARWKDGFTPALVRYPRTGALAVRSAGKWFGEQRQLGDRLFSAAARQSYTVITRPENLRAFLSPPRPDSWDPSTMTEEEAKEIADFLGKLEW